MTHFPGPARRPFAAVPQQTKMGAVSPASRYHPRPDRALRRRALVNRLNLTTGLGLGVARLGGAVVQPGPEGLLLGEGYRLGFPVAGAFTIGNVVLSAHSFAALEAASPGLLAHESRHAWQYYRLGLAFLPCYGAAAAWSWLRYGDPATGNTFERRAGLVTGGYVPTALQPPQPRAVLRRTPLKLRRARRGSDDGPTGSPAAAPAADEAASPRGASGPAQPDRRAAR